ncbi:MAG TPA: hypothetical protein VEA99_20850, partial [Gemmatimonadaceae bacterium]|nr:hypothetical protein [Gemmatimonadaceae bacterium]
MPRRASDPPSTAKTKRGVRKTRPSAQEHAQHAQHSPQADPILVPHRTARTAQELYRAEKERRTRSPEQDLLAEARREYLALLASEAGGPKGGRPRKVGRPKKAAAAEPADDFEDVT